MTRFSIGFKYEYCPNGNYWTEVSGIFDKQIYLFCDCKKCKGQVYTLRPTNITKKVSKEQIDVFRKNIKLDKIRDEIDQTNMNEVEILLDKLKAK